MWQGKTVFLAAVLATIALFKSPGRVYDTSQGSRKVVNFVGRGDTAEWTRLVASGRTKDVDFVPTRCISAPLWPRVITPRHLPRIVFTKIPALLGSLQYGTGSLCPRLWSWLSLLYNAFQKATVQENTMVVFSVRQGGNFPFQHFVPVYTVRFAFECVQFLVMGSFSLVWLTPFSYGDKKASAF